MRVDCSGMAVEGFVWLKGFADSKIEGDISWTSTGYDPWISQCRVVDFPCEVEPEGTDGRTYPEPEPAVPCEVSREGVEAEGIGAVAVPDVADVGEEGDAGLLAEEMEEFEAVLKGHFKLDVGSEV